MYPLPFLFQLESVHPPTLIFPISSTKPFFGITFSSKANTRLIGLKVEPGSNNLENTNS